MAGQVGLMMFPIQIWKKPQICYPHLIGVIKVTRRDTSVEILLSSQRAAFDHVLSKYKNWCKKIRFLSCCQQVSIILDCQYLLLGSVGDSDTGVSHSEALPNYRNMIRKGQQTPVELWVADNLFSEKVTGIWVLQAVREDVFCCCSCCKGTL